MKRSRFSEEQIIGILKEHEAGIPVAELVPQARGERRQRVQVESEVRRDGGVRGQATAGVGGWNAKLKRMLADAMLDNVALKDLLGKKW